MGDSPFKNEFGVNKVVGGKYVLVYIDYENFSNLLTLFDIDIKSVPKRSYYLVDIIFDNKWKYVSHANASLKTIMGLNFINTILKDNFKTRTILHMEIIKKDTKSQIQFSTKNIISNSIKINIIKSLLNNNVSHEHIIKYIQL
jgi:hypothetical protein